MLRMFRARLVRNAVWLDVLLFGWMDRDATMLWERLSGVGAHLFCPWREWVPVANWGDRCVGRFLSAAARVGSDLEVVDVGVLTRFGGWVAGSDVYHLPVLPAFIGSGVQLSAFEGGLLRGSGSLLPYVVGGDVEGMLGGCVVVRGGRRKCRRLFGGRPDRGRV